MGRDDLDRLLAGARRIDGPQQIAIREQRIISPGLMYAKEGGLGVDKCDLHIAIVDVPSGVVWLLPHNVNAFRDFADQIHKLCDGIEHTES